MISTVTQASGNSAAIAAPTRVLVADYDADLLALISFVLRNAGFHVDVVTSSAAALTAFEHKQYSLLLLDINMPKLSAIDVCERVREHSMLPILMLSARNQENDLVKALEVGADGYIVKPFTPRALIARIGALLRRSSLQNNVSSTVIESGNYRLDIEAHKFLTSDQEVRLTKLELKLMQALMLNANQAIDTKTLVGELWPSRGASNRNSLKQVVFRLRKKLTSVPTAATALVTAPGGYMWSIVYE